MASLGFLNNVTPNTSVLLIFEEVGKALGYNGRQYRGVVNRSKDLAREHLGESIAPVTLAHINRLPVDVAFAVAGKLPGGQDVFWTTMGLVFPNADLRDVYKFA
jgi:hypothetical protein